MSAWPCSNSLPWLENGSSPRGLITLMSVVFSTSFSFGPGDGEAFAREQAFVVGHQLRQSLEWRCRLQDQVFHGSCSSVEPARRSIAARGYQISDRWTAAFPAAARPRSALHSSGLHNSIAPSETDGHRPELSSLPTLDT